MGKSVLVFISHSSEDKEPYIEPIAKDLENCFINVWIDKRKIVPGDNIRKSIFRDGLDKADVVLIFFTEQSLKSAWVDREIKHVLREETNKGNNFDLNKIISIFDSEKTYEKISKRYPELTDDLLHLMPPDYDKTRLGQLISAIWSKYLSLQGGDVEIQRQLLGKEKEIFQREKEVLELKQALKDAVSKNEATKSQNEFRKMAQSGLLDDFIKKKDVMLRTDAFQKVQIQNITDAVALGLVDHINNDYGKLTAKGKSFFQWFVLESSEKS
jgi:hypothetical protein